jgi:hypothetical protein
MCSIIETIKKVYLYCVDVICGKDRVMQTIRISHTPEKTVWDMLAADGKYDLIRRLQRVERGEPGYGTMIIPEGGWSRDPGTNDRVLCWLKDRHVNVWSPTQEIAELEQSLQIG